MASPLDIRPAADESSEFYHGYIAAVPDGDLIAHLEEQTADVHALLSSLSEEAALHRYAAGKWSVKEIVGHLIDVERVMGYRLLRISRGDMTPLSGFDHDAYVPAGRFDRLPLRALLDEHSAVRASTLALIRRLEAEDLDHRGSANSNPVTARALVWIIPGHERHHVRILRERYGLR